MPVLIQIGEPLLAMSFMETFRQPWAARMGWTLLHSLWQLTAIAVIYGAVDRLLVRRTSQVRYVAAVLALAAMALTPIATWSVIKVAPVPESAGLQEHHSAPAAQRSLTHPATESTDNPNRETQTTLVVADDSASLPRYSTDARGATNPETPSYGINAHPILHANRSQPTSRLKAWLEPWLGALVTAWLIGVSLAALRPLVGLWTQVRLRRVGLTPLPPAIHELLSRLMIQMGIRKPLRIYSSSLIQSPAVVGYLKPLILLPVTALTGLSTRELEAVLAHELAHVRRHDWLVNAFQLAIETVLFFHPAMWWVSQRIRQERENCCDDIAVAVVGDRVLYGRLLLTMEHLRRHAPAAVLGADGGSLVQRIRRLAGREPQTPRVWEDFSMSTFLVVLGLLGIMGKTYTQAEQTEPPNSERPAQVEDKARVQPPTVPTNGSQSIPDDAVPKSKPVENSPDSKVTTEIELPENWFRPDPYPGLGHSDELGEGWRYLRLATDSYASQEVGLSEVQLKAFIALYDETNKRQAAVRGDDFAKQRVAVWLEGQAAGRKLVDEAQDRRIRQIAMQRR